MNKLTLFLAFALGYVLGARAGRERYETIRSAAKRVKNDPRTQHAVHSAADVAKQQAPVVKDKLTDVAAAAVDKVKPGSDPGDDLNPDSLHFQKDPFPQGHLP